MTTTVVSNRYVLRSWTLAIYLLLMTLTVHFLQDQNEREVDFRMEGRGMPSRTGASMDTSAAPKALKMGSQNTGTYI
jgi:hypothetical protein